MGLIAKLKVKPEKELCLIDAPADIIGIFSSLKCGFVLPQGKTVEQLIFFAKNKDHLEQKSPAILNGLKQDALLWIAYPKKSGSIQSDLIRDEGWNIMYHSEWQGVASISINEDWSGMRFRHISATRSLKRLPPVEERKTEGIDYINRTVTLPDDAAEVMRLFEGLEEFFYSMSFTHKKENVEAIVQAKKPETRQRRIEKMIEMISKMKEQKEAKIKKRK